MYFSSAVLFWIQLLSPGPVSCYQGCYGLQLFASSSCHQVCSSSVLYGPQALLNHIRDSESWTLLTHQRHLHPLDKLHAPQPLSSHRAPRPSSSGSSRGCGGSGPPRCTGHTLPRPTSPVQLLLSSRMVLSGCSASLYPDRLRCGPGEDLQRSLLHPHSSGLTLILSAEWSSQLCFNPAGELCLCNPLSQRLPLVFHLCPEARPSRVTVSTELIKPFEPCPVLSAAAAVTSTTDRQVTGAGRRQLQFLSVTYNNLTSV